MAQQQKTQIQVVEALLSLMVNSIIQHPHPHAQRKKAKQCPWRDGKIQIRESLSDAYPLWLELGGLKGLPFVLGSFKIARGLAR